MHYKYSLLTVIASLLFVSLAGCGASQQLKKGGEVNAMERRIINPWTWQEKLGFVQSNEVTDAKRMLFTAGIVSVDGEGNLLYPGDMVNQVEQVLDNLEVLLDQAGFELADVVRFTYYTTDIPGFTSAAKTGLVKRLTKAGAASRPLR